MLGYRLVIVIHSRVRFQIGSTCDGKTGPALPVSCSAGLSISRRSGKQTPEAARNKSISWESVTQTVDYPDSCEAAKNQSMSHGKSAEVDMTSKKKCEKAQLGT